MNQASLFDLAPEVESNEPERFCFEPTAAELARQKWQRMTPKKWAQHHKRQLKILWDRYDLYSTSVRFTPGSQYATLLDIRRYHELNGLDVPLEVTIRIKMHEIAQRKHWEGLQP